MKIPFKNIEIHFSKLGTGDAILWLHGFMETQKIWGNQVSFFENSFTNICIDLLGHGKTGNIAEVHTMELQAEAVLAVIKYLRIETFSIVGHSMGGYIALAILEKVPYKISHFVLLNSTSYPDNEEKKINRDRAVKIVKEQKNNFARMGVINLFSETTRDQFRSEIETIITNAQNLSENGIISALKGMKIRVKRTDILKQFSGKKLTVIGKEDPVLNYHHSLKEAEETLSTPLLVGGGHMSYLEVSTLLNRELSNFFKLNL